MMAPSKRRPSTKTRRLLDIQSLNQCAYPGCSNPLVEPRAGKSSAVVTGDICHIHAVSPGGPRWKEELGEEELNSAGNLILLCKNCHATVDLQPEFHTAELLKQWKSAHEAQAHRISPGQNLICEVLGNRILEKTSILRQLRFFPSFDETSFALDLARDLIVGELSIGPEAARSSALAWCARVLSSTEHLPKARECLELAKALPPCEEVGIAEAYLSPTGQDKSAALSTLLRRDSPMSRSAALGLVTLKDGVQAAIHWLRDAQIEASGLDGEGKLRLLGNYLQLGDLDSAKRHLDVITPSDLREAPSLYRTMAMACLLGAVPQELHSIVIHQLPLGAKVFPLGTHSDAMEGRRRARRLFLKAAEATKELGCPSEAAMDEEYALWLDLRDPDEADGALQRLAQRLSDSESQGSLRFVRLAVEFGIDLDHEAIDREIKRQVTLHGAITEEAALARFALAVAQPSPKEQARYLSRYFNEIVQRVNATTVSSVQIQLRCQAGEVDLAHRTLADLQSGGDLSEEEAGRLRALISEAEGAEGVHTAGVYERHFRDTGSLPDLAILVEHLVEQQNWESLGEYAKTLFDRTQSVTDAERFAFALFSTQRMDELSEFIESIGDSFLNHSARLRLFRCWTLYFQGSVIQAQGELTSLEAVWDDPVYRELYVSLAISSGDWNSLTSMVDADWAQRSERNAQELIRAAQLAFFLGMPLARELLSAGTAKGWDDPEILVTAYLLANRMSLEGDEEVWEWIDRAAQLSGDDGPVKLLPLHGLHAQTEAWRRRESEPGELLRRGEIPLFLAAQSLNRSLGEVMLLPALSNLKEKDPRRRGPVPAYGGSRRGGPVELGKSAAFDASALLTLGYLDVLEAAFDSFEAVYLPHSTLGWLFEERQRAAFHQPSRIQDAVEVSQMLASGVLERLVGGVAPNSELADQIGEDLAQLIAEAGQGGCRDGQQRLVVHPGPVQRAGSLMTEEVDLTAHASILVGCGSLVGKLRGHITSQAGKKARAYLQTKERPWPAEGPIRDGAVLYMDNLPITYLHHLGLLEEIARAGFRIVVSPSVVAEAEYLVRYSKTASEALQIMERIQTVVSERIASGRIRLGKAPDFANPEGALEDREYQHPSRCVFLLAGECEAVVSDDRFLNQHPKVGNGCESALTYTTLDLVGALGTGHIACGDAWEYLTKLRRAGYSYVPVGEEELESYLRISPVESGRVRETAELRAIRENLLGVRMRSMLQIPSELPWLVDLLRTLTQVIRNLWGGADDYSEVRARANWIVDQIDIRAWAHHLGAEGGKDLVRAGRGPYLLLFLMPPIPCTPEVREEFWKWAEERILAPIKEQDPDLFSWIVEFQRRHIAEVASKNPFEEGNWDA